jgi:hypothetical protein
MSALKLFVAFSMLSFFGMAQNADFKLPPSRQLNKNAAIKATSVQTNTTSKQAEQPAKPEEPKAVQEPARPEEPRAIEETRKIEEIKPIEESAKPREIKEVEEHKKPKQ